MRFKDLPANGLLVPVALNTTFFQVRPKISSVVKKNVLRSWRDTCQKRSTTMRKNMDVFDNESLHCLLDV